MTNISRLAVVVLPKIAFNASTSCNGPNVCNGCNSLNGHTNCDDHNGCEGYNVITPSLTFLDCLKGLEPWSRGWIQLCE